MRAFFRFDRSDLPGDVVGRSVDRHSQRRGVLSGCCGRFWRGFDASVLGALVASIGAECGEQVRAEHELAPADSLYRARERAGLCHLARLAAAQAEGAASCIERHGDRKCAEFVGGH